MNAKGMELTPEEQASETFVARLSGEWSRGDEENLSARLAQDPGYATAFRRVERSWASLGTNAESPELMRYREEALAYARHSSGRRWLRSGPFVRARGRTALAAAACAALALAGGWQLYARLLRAEEYRTGLGEQRAVELADHSRIALDSATRIRVSFSADARIVELEEGQAQFTVAHDLTRPFKVRAGSQTIVALGTVFTVEYVDQQVRVAMVEGRVAVVGTPGHAPSQPADAGERSPAAPDEQGSARAAPRGAGEAAHEQALRRAAGRGAIELSAGEALNVDERGGDAVVVPKADLEAATAWRSGKMIFRSEALEAAVRRVNRYSRTRIAIADAPLASREISGVFDEGDSQAFVSALQEYLPISVDYGDSVITLRSRSPR